MIFDTRNLRKHFSTFFVKKSPKTFQVKQYSEQQRREMSNVYSRLNTTQNGSGERYLFQVKQHSEQQRRVISILGETTLRIVASEINVYSRRNTTQNGSGERYLLQVKHSILIQVMTQIHVEIFHMQLVHLDLMPPSPIYIANVFIFISSRFLLP